MQAILSIRATVLAVFEKPTGDYQTLFNLGRSITVGITRAEQ